MIKFLKSSKLDQYISDSSYSGGSPASFNNLLFCEGISLSLQFRLINPLKYLLLPSVMNNTEQLYCFDTYHNIMNQSLFHLAAKSRASGFVRLFFHLPISLPVLRHLHISNQGLIKQINPKNPIINQQMVKKRVSDLDVLILLKAAFKLNMRNEWYLRKDINGHTAFNLWSGRSPFYLRFVYYHSVISKLFSSHHKHLELEYNSCISMQYVSNFWPIVQWMPIRTTPDNMEVAEVTSQSEFDTLFPIKWSEQQPLIFRNGMTAKWNLSQLSISNLSEILKSETFLTSSIPYEDLYENKFVNEETKAKQMKEKSVTFAEYTEKYFGDDHTANLDSMCNEINKKKKGNASSIPYIFDSGLFWRNSEFAQRFNVSELIPKHIYNLMQSMIDDYDEKYDENEEYVDEDKIAFDLEEIVQSAVMLKQVSIGGKFSGAQPHFHGPVLNALLMGQKEWIIFPPQKSFQTKQTAIEFFCNHHNMKQERREKLTYFTFTQNVGDVVFIPREWTHAVLNTQPSIGVAVEMFI